MATPTGKALPLDTSASRFLSQFYPGWQVHAGLFLCALVVVGSSTYTFGLFVVPVGDELAISRANINNGFIAFLLGVGVLSPIVGRLLDRYSARMVILSGGLLFACGMIGIATAESPLVMLLVISGPLSYGYAACGTLGANTVVVRWFKRRRGIALGTMAVATSAGGFVFAPFTAAIIENFGWRQALISNGLIAAAATLVMTALIIRNYPTGSEAGYAREFLSEAEDPSNGDPAATPSERSWTYRALLGNRNFWLLTLGIGLLYGSDQAMVTSNVPYFQDIGIDLQAAAFIVSCTTVSAICGKLFVGYLADKVDLRFVYYAVALAHIALLVVYLLAPGYWTLLFFATLFGVAIGGVFPVWSTLLAWLFGSANYGMIMGTMTIIFKGISIVTVRFIGEVHDASGSYHPAFYVFMAMVAAGVVLISLVRPEREQQ